LNYKKPFFSGVPGHSLKVAKLILPSKNLREVTKQNTKDHNHTTFVPFYYTSLQLGNFNNVEKVVPFGLKF
jgi:hypothetical protein